MANYGVAPKKRWFVAEDGKELLEARPYPNNQYQCEVIIERLNAELEVTRNLTVESEVID
tara:strand:- start:326 stop:505 length:180 start_codon:yes stop_codon:yes gene_type:complete